MAPDTGRCTVASVARDESLAGTAPVARRWVLVEHVGPWARRALETPPFAGPIGLRFREVLDQNNAEVLLVRRPGRQPEEGEPRAWFVVDTMTGDSISGTWQRDRDLEAVLTALTTINGPFAEPAPPMVLVCTHGIRDACCAIKGRPLVGMLNRAFDGEVWECSHLGGHRFAGNALVLPDGACYGRLGQGDVVRVVTDHREGRVDARHLRGLTALPQLAQAAHVWGLSELAQRNPHGRRGIHDVEIGTIGILDDDVMRPEAVTPVDADPKSESKADAKVDARVDAELDPDADLDADARREGVEPQGEIVTPVEVLGLLPEHEPVVVEVVTEQLPLATLSCGKAPQSAVGYRVRASSSESN